MGQIVSAEGASSSYKAVNYCLPTSSQKKEKLRDTKRGFVLLYKVIKTGDDDLLSLKNDFPLYPPYNFGTYVAM